MKNFASVTAILLFLLSANGFAKSNKISSSEHKKYKLECYNQGFKYKRSKGECSTRKHSKAKKCDKAKGEWKLEDGKSKASCSGGSEKISSSEHKKRKKECADKGLKYRKSKATCSSKKHSKARKCERNGGEYSEGKCSVDSKKNLKKVKKKCEKEGFLFDAKNFKCTTEISHERKKCEDKGGDFKRGKCKLGKSYRDQVRKICEEKGLKYSRKKNECNEKKFSKEKRRCLRRFKIVDGQKAEAVFSKGKCDVSKSEFKSILKDYKKLCANKGYKYDKKIKDCSDHKKTRAAIKCEKAGKKLVDGKCDVDKELLKCSRKGGSIINGKCVISTNPKEVKCIQMGGAWNQAENKCDQQRAKSRKQSKQQRKACKANGFVYDKHQGLCTEEHHKKYKDCELRKGEWVVDSVKMKGKCEGGTSKKDLRKAKRDKRRGKRSEVKELKKHYLADAKKSFQECKADAKVVSKKMCKQLYKMEKRTIKAFYNNEFWRGEQFKECLKEAKGDQADVDKLEIDLSKVTQEQKILINKCFKERNKRRVIKSGIIALTAASYVLLPAAGPTAVAMFLADGAKGLAESRLRNLEKKVVEHVKEFAVQEGVRLTHSQLEDVLTVTRKAFLLKEGYTEEEIANGAYEKLSRKKKRKLGRKENRESRRWRRSALKQARINFKNCKRNRVFSLDRCKYLKRLQTSKIKAQVQSKLWTDNATKACLEEAGEDEVKIEQCYHLRRKNIGKTFLLTAISGAAVAISPDNIRKYLTERLGKMGKNIQSGLLKEIQEETVDKVIDEFAQQLQTVTQSDLEKVNEITKLEACRKLKISCDDASLSKLSEKDKSKLLKKADQEFIKMQYEACVKNPKYSKYECKEYKKVQLDAIKLKYRSGFLRNKGFKQCIAEAEKKGDSESILYKVAVHECFANRRKKRTRIAVIALITTGALVGTYTILPDQLKKTVADEIKKLVKDEVDSQINSQIESGFKTFNKEVTGQEDFNKTAAFISLAILKGAKELEAETGISMKSETVIQLKKQAMEEYYEQIGKKEGDFLTTQEKRGLRKHVKDYVKAAHKKDIEGIEVAYKSCKLAKSSDPKSKLNCNEVRRSLKRLVKAKYGGDFLRSPTFKDCLRKALDKEAIEAQAAVNKCYKGRAKKRWKAVLIVAGVVAAGWATYELGNDEVKAWMDEHLLDKAKNNYVEVSKNELMSLRASFRSQIFEEALDAGMTPIEATNVYKKAQIKFDKFFESMDLNQDKE